ncbi:hypothetical protein PR202_ga04487 [Eleusine coracana subsp. coracana]|uniref:Cytochrome P450 n=1 Tax=Eleusine coracana subsp. coracana TaxID=191504 RepID=A0AAV5BR48_ELECO|nr:hypothetical protein PR202_ga04487 [Eleusine coracana subsp. coracana]
MVVSADPEVNRFIFQQEGKLFRSWYLETANIIIGEKTIDEFNGTAQKFVRNFMSGLFGLECLKKELLPELEKHIEDSLAEWSAQPDINVNDSTTDGKKNMLKIMSDLLRRRLSEPYKKHGDLVDIMVKELKSEKPTINEEFAIDALSALLFTSFVTLSPNLSLAFKFLSDNPNVLKTLKEENEAILINREDLSSGFTWQEYKSLTFTIMVINELTRMSNVTPGIFRKTLTDVQVNGYVIPAGWMVMMSPMSIHLNPIFFQDPLKFNPWRWLDESKGSTLKNFVPFGLGIRACPAAEFSKLFMALFLHVLVTKYRRSSWKKTKGGEVSRRAIITFPNGYQIKVLPKT